MMKPIDSHHDTQTERLKVGGAFSESLLTSNMSVLVNVMGGVGGCWNGKAIISTCWRLAIPAEMKRITNVVLCLVQLARLFWNAVLMDVLICSFCISTVATSSDFSSTIQQGLDAEVDVWPLGSSGNLHAICQRGERTVGPA